MKYKIGDVAKLLGITTEGLRYYEKFGIVTPKKQEGSSFRYYDVWDIHILVRVKAYRSLGFSLHEISSIINSNNYIDMPSSLTDKIKDLENTIVYNLNLIKRASQLRSMFKDAQSMKYRYRLEYCPGIYRINTQDEYTLYRDETVLSLAHDWISKAPFVFTSGLFSKEELLKCGSNYNFGFGVEEEYADYLQVKPDDEVKYYPPRLCVYTAMPSDSTTLLSTSHLSGAMEYIHSKGLKLADDAFSCVFDFHKDEDVYKDLHCIWFPVEE